MKWFDNTLVQVERLGVQRVDANGAKATAYTASSSYGYDQLGQRLSQQDAAGNVLKTDYDGLGRVVKTVSAQGLATSYRYDYRAAGAADGVAGAGGANIGGYLRTTSEADGRSSADKIDYFGRTTWHRDLSGAAYTYNYDSGGRLASQTSSVHAGQTQGQDIRYEYYANGFVKSMTDSTAGTVGDYGYDNAGNRVYEGYFQLVNGSKGASYQSALIQYDELNRMAGARDLNFFDIRYEYDAVGNRRLVKSVYWDGLGGARDGNQVYWYDYDAMNRFTVTKGTLSGARATSKTDTAIKVVAGTEGTSLAYDRLGQRRAAQSAHSR